ncbi:MAG: AAA family ATPase, partial [Gammaproteobacteria bacterium]
MRLISLRVDYWRGLDRAEVGPLSPSLNIITGPNRAGKSRLQQAVRFGLLESSKGSAKQKAALQSWHHTDPPHVVITFEADGAEYELQKQFLKNPYTKLGGRGRTWDGQEAEAELRVLLGTRPGKREVELVDSGIWPLLWVEQGTANVVPHEHMNEDSRMQLHARLAAEVGAATVGPIGQSVLALAKAEYERYFTANERERLDLNKAREAVDSRQADVNEARRRHATIHEIAGQVERHRAVLDGMTPRIQELHRHQQEAAAKADRATKARSALSLAEQQVRLRELKRDTAHAERQARVDREIALAEAEKQQKAADTQRQQRQSDFEEANRAFAHVVAMVIKAEEASATARTALLQTQAAERKKAWIQQLREVTKRLDVTKSVAERVRSLTKELGSYGAITEQAVKKLRQADRDAQAREAELKGAAVTVTMKALKDTTINNKAWKKGESSTASLCDPAKIAIADLVVIGIQPGGSDLTGLRDKANDARQELHDRLTELGVENLAEAEGQLQKRERIAGQLGEAQKRFEEMAPTGIEAIDAEQVRLQAESDAIEVPADVPSRRDAESKAESADSELAQARTTRDHAQKKAHDAQVTLVEAGGALRSITDRIDVLRKELAAMAPAEKLTGNAEAAKREWEEAVVMKDNALRAFDAAGGEVAQLEAEQANKALQGLEQAQRQTDNELRQAHGKLQQAQTHTAHESMQDAEGALEQARAYLSRLSRQGQAAKALWTALSARRRALQERLTRPVVQRVGTYLTTLFPGCQLAMTDELEIGGLVAGNQLEGFEALSGGEKEQLGLLVRLALADVLRRDGTLPLLLDDSMVNSDSQRIQQLQTLLYRAARKLQIIVFSCHHTLLDKLGADYHQELPPRLRTAVPIITA